MKEISTCPVCHASSLEPLLETRDFFLTGEVFGILLCRSCQCLLTSPQPETTELNRYYQSDMYVSHRVVARGLKDTLYVMVRNIALRKKFRLIRSLAGHTRGTILDVGCGSGEWLNLFNRRKWTVDGIEPAAIARQAAQVKYQLNVGDIDYLKDLKSAYYDVITLWHSLEHIADLEETMVHLKRLLATHGILVVAVPNYQAWDASFYGIHWAAWDVPRHLYHFAPVSLQTLMNNHKLKIIKRIPMKWDAYYISLLSEKYKRGRSDYCRAFRNGWRSNRYARLNGDAYSSLIYVMNHEMM